MPLNGTIVSVTENYAFLDAGVLRDVVDAGTPTGKDDNNRRRGKSKTRNVNGRLYRLDLMEKYALSNKRKGAKTEAVLAPGMSLQVCPLPCM